MAATRCYDNLGCYESSILHALPQEPTHLRTRYTVSCRGHVDDAVIFATDGKTAMKSKIEKSCFSVDKPIKLLTHGFNGKGTAAWVLSMRDAFLAKEDCNVVVVDWHHGATYPYEQAVANSLLVARQVGNFIRHLELVHGVPPLTVHLIGHSIGAHISGNAGAAVAPSRVARVSGLDPAEPYFDRLDDSLRLDPSDAIFVDVIHTDAETFTGLKGYGSVRRQGHVDFYPNGGVRQPGCISPSDLANLLPDTATYSRSGIACSHSRALYLFIESLNSHSGEDIGKSSGSNTTGTSSVTGSCSMSDAADCQSWEDFESGNCKSCPGKACLLMGYYADKFPAARGSIYLSTTSNAPFCGKDYLVSVQVSPDQGHAFGRLILVLENNTSLLEILDFSRADRHYRSLRTETHVMTIAASVGDALTLDAVFLPGSGLSSLGTTSSLSIERVDVTDLADSNNRWSFCRSDGQVLQAGDDGSKQTLTIC
ncbi:transposase [Plakobranchus ocellatus]|uniref:Transposase n=1 Tax=Plakobranchus ocellatus TaxID=259542 RepID=A0AAV3Z1C0_9GAST|nr:transposase [Plakobranchus ocellatus]